MFGIDQNFSFGQPPLQFYLSDTIFTCLGQLDSLIISIPVKGEKLWIWHFLAKGSSKLKLPPYLNNKHKVTN